MKAQTEDVLRQIDALLAKNGSNKSRILTATVYVNDMKLKPRDGRGVAGVGRSARTRRRAPRCEAQLGSPDTLVEIMCTAAKEP